MSQEFSLLENVAKVVILDPPWGGKYYKKQKDKKPIMMGSWTMTQVVDAIHQYMSPTLIGIRMPVDFDCESFVKRLQETKVTFLLKERKKIGPQLFMVLSV
jgi:predicted RNA methylase